MEMYEVVDMGNWTVIARGFRTRSAAERWALDNDWGQYEYGWSIYAYWADVDFT